MHNVEMKKFTVVYAKKKCCLKLSHIALITVIWVQQFCLYYNYNISMSLDVSQPPNAFKK